MYVDGKMIKGLFQLGALAARGVSAVVAHRRTRNSEADELTRMAGGVPEGESGCGECAEEKQRMIDEANEWSLGLGDGR
jgi:hypothetical protein